MNSAIPMIKHVTKNSYRQQKSKETQCGTIGFVPVYIGPVIQRFLNNRNIKCKYQAKYPKLNFSLNSKILKASRTSDKFHYLVKFPLSVKSGIL